MPDSIHKLTDDDLEVVAGGTSPQESKAKYMGGSTADHEKLAKGGKVGGGATGKGPPLPPKKTP